VVFFDIDPFLDTTEMMKRFLLFFLLLFTGINLPARTISDNQILTIKNGLSQSLIYCIFQDTKGFMWFGTKDGLNRYDGYEFKIYHQQPGNRHSLSNDDIRAITEDKSGNLWIGTYGGGLNKFNPVTQQFRAYRSFPNDTSTLTSDMITGLAWQQNSQDTILWVATINGFNRFNVKTGVNERFYPQRYFRSKQNFNNIRDIATDKKGNVWIIIRNGGLYRFDYDHKKLVEIPCRNSLKNPIVTCLAVNKKGTLFAGTENGIFYYNDTTRSLIKLPGKKKYFLVIKTLLAQNGKLLFTNYITPGLLFAYDLKNDSVSEFDNYPLFFPVRIRAVLSVYSKTIQEIFG
jgi:ligand-binding sensor domain-containing protein